MNKTHALTMLGLRYSHAVHLGAFVNFMNSDEMVAFGMLIVAIGTFFVLLIWG
jgi:hypothetical protein